eukprot:GHVS01078439.1.p1 GENE.GHVS01078439.1~~GHVS01078439.1.p1  ORF type:complete len:851 (-),score=112.40 GHVS01078439.1:245-2797(-)
MEVSTEAVDAVGGGSRKFYVFPNEFFADTYVERMPEETSNDRNDRAIRQASLWYQQHLQMVDTEAQLILITYDQKNKELAMCEGIVAMTAHEYADSVRWKFPRAGEKLTDISNEIAQKQPSDKSPIFDAHLPDSAITAKLRDKTIIRGTIRMRRHDKGFVTITSRDKSKVDTEDILIDGKSNVNRAVDGDVVAVEVVNYSTSSSPSSGKVVGIIKRNWIEYYGSLQPLPTTTTGKDQSAFVKTERIFEAFSVSIPWISIKTRQSQDLDGKRIGVVIDSWDRFSNKPSGHWVRILGAIGDRDTESEVILRTFGVVTREFSSSVLRCLPPADWQIPESEIAKRLDLRQEIICSIDPAGCKDIDDALSAKKLPNGNYQVGVHIADVTHFVKAETAIDREAAERCTTVYLVERRTDMLPGLLTTDLCSLVAHEDRLAFSVLWEMTEDAEIISTSFHKTVIRSSKAFEYLQAQRAIDNRTDKSPPTENIRILNRLAKKLRSKRMDKGALELASAEVGFEMDSESPDPRDMAAYESMETNKLVEEFMLLGNCTVAEKILHHFPFCSVLRRHPPPKDGALKTLQQLMASNGFDNFSFGDSKELSASLDRAVKPEEPYFNKLIRILTTRCMNQAVYFCTGELGGSKALYRHYGLAAELYTHFTSPIRRYSDVLVHRLLAACLGIEDLCDRAKTKKEVHEQCEVLNTKHRNAQMAGRSSVEFHRYRYFKKHGPLSVDCIIIKIKPKQLSVFLPGYGMQESVALDEENYSTKEIISAEASTEENKEESLEGCLRAVHKGDDRSLDLNIFDHVMVTVSANESDLRNRYDLKLERKSTTGDIRENELSEAEKRKIDEDIINL